RNSITTVMQIFISVGTFGIYGALNLLVGDSAASAQMIYGVAAIIVCSLYLISQILICVGCKEHERDPEEEKKEQEDVKFSDMFKLLKNNKHFRVNIIAILLQYLGSGVVVGFATYYFYLTYGYGTSADTIFMFTIMYAVGTLLAQFLYPLLNKFIKRKGLFLISAIALVFGYVSMFIFGFPIFSSKPIAQIGDWTIILLYVAGAVLFFGQGIMSIAQIVQMQSTIEYNELETGERKEAIASSMRALVAKFGSAIQRLLIFVTLSATMLYGITQKISEFEYLKAAGDMTAEQVKTAAIDVIQGIQPGQFIGLAVGMLLIPLLCLLGSCFLSGKVFGIDEKKYKEICEQLDAKKSDEKVEEKAE
ncbi:MAG: MFS transporter, partial [Bacilli bacterium]|nr:MFS transporter [Bacilli bacterium]